MPSGVTEDSLAIWGDLGILGLAACGYLCWLSWRYLCLDDVSKWQMLTVFVHGLIFTQIQEPGYMLFITALIGLGWQEARSKARLHNQSKASN
ncbi:hypothetical protein H6F89_15130 [Cyanobacteria bacterium FACHB-63]|nr:hypothetical protein [Cyanobacteria bacterium FACHB-63]